MLKRWDALPQEMKQEEVKKYYKYLSKAWDTCCQTFFGRGFGIYFNRSFVTSDANTGRCIKLDSKGPVFYRQERVTQYGKKYRIFKFRTMVTDADKKGPLVTTGQDSRITRMGNKLRKCRLDELPQLFNVLTGDMSFVGTRPEVQKYVQSYSPEMMATLLLPAGITSRTSIVYKDEDEILDKYSQTTDKSTDEIYVEYVLPEKMKYNLEYLKQFSIWGDFKIMIDTALAVLR